MIHRPETGHKNDFNMRMGMLETLQQNHPAALRHAYVGQYQVHMVRLGQRQSLISGSGRQCVQLHFFRHIPAEVESGGVVICNQDNKRVTGNVVPVGPGHGGKNEAARA